MVDVNLKGALYTVAAALPVFARQKSGHIVTVTGSDVAFGGAVYGATQHAVRAFTQGLQKEVRGVRATVVSPGKAEVDGAELGRLMSPEEFYRKTAIPADAVARAIALAIEQPGEVHMREIVVTR